jgi:hypothetical protein
MVVTRWVSRALRPWLYDFAPAGLPAHLLMRRALLIGLLTALSALIACYPPAQNTYCTRSISITAE